MSYHRRQLRKELRALWNARELEIVDKKKNVDIEELKSAKERVAVAYDKTTKAHTAYMEARVAEMKCRQVLKDIKAESKNIAAGDDDWMSSAKISRLLSGVGLGIGANVTVSGKGLIHIVATHLDGKGRLKPMSVKGKSLGKLINYSIWKPSHDLDPQLQDDG